MKVVTSYFYQIRHFSSNMIPISTTFSDPFWYHDGTYDDDYIFKDKRGIYNGIRTNDFLIEHEECGCGPTCQETPSTCSFLKVYRKHLDTLDFNKFIQELERIANKIQQIEHFKEEPVIALMVYEAPYNKCSERGAIQDWFYSNGWPIKEWKKE